MKGPAGAAAAPAIADVLSRGLTLPLTKAAIDTLAELESGAGRAAIAMYATHRDVSIRRAAVKALTRTKGAASAAVLKRALSDADAVVRGTAASGLGALKAKDAVPDLVVALDHRVNEAAAAIGQLCMADACEQLAAKLGKLPFDIVTSGLDPVLFRASTEVNDDAKIIGRIRDLATGESNRFLKDVQKRWPASGSARVRQAIDQAVLATAAIRGRSVRPARARHVRDAPLRSPRVAGVSDPRECACGAAKPRSFSPNASQATGERAKRAEGASTRHARR